MKCTECVEIAIAAVNAANAAYNDPQSPHYQDTAWLSEKFDEANTALKACLETCDT